MRFEVGFHGPIPQVHLSGAEGWVRESIEGLGEFWRKGRVWGLRKHVCVTSVNYDARSDRNVH